MRMSADDELVLRPSLCPHHALVFAARGRSYRELPLRIAELGGMYRAGALRRAGRTEPGAGHLAQRRAQLLRARTRSATRCAGELALIRQAHAGLGVRAAASGCRCAARAASTSATRRCGQRAPSGAAGGAGRGRRRVRRGARRGGVLRAEDRHPDRRRRRARVRPSPPSRSTSTSRPGSGCPTWPPTAPGRRPVMIHRSMVGSMERLFAHLIEVHGGAFPAWYAPVQLEVLPVAPSRRTPAAAVRRGGRRGRPAGRGVGAGSLGSRIRQSALRKVPYVAVIGAREAASGRSRCVCGTDAAWTRSPPPTPWPWSRRWSPPGRRRCCPDPGPSPGPGSIAVAGSPATTISPGPRRRFAARGRGVGPDRAG